MNNQEKDYRARIDEAIEALYRGEKRDEHMLALLIDPNTGRMPDEMYKKDPEDLQRWFDSSPDKRC